MPGPTTTQAAGTPPGAYDLGFGPAAKYAGVAASTLRRWHVRGVPGPRERVRLQALRKGGVYHTSRAMIDDVLAACNPLHLGGGDGGPGDAGPTPLTRSEAARLAEAYEQLRRLGV